MRGIYLDPQWSNSVNIVATVVLFLVSGIAFAAPAVEYSIGGVSDDFFGRNELVGQTAFNGLTLSASGSSGQFDYGLTLAAQPEESHDALPHFELGIRFADDIWKAGISKEPRHWSPSNHTSLILSQNAESMPAVYLRKSELTKSRYALFSWIGKFKGEFFVGQTNDSLNGDDALFIGNQLILQPIEDLEIEFVRTIQLGGSGQDADADVFLRALIGDTNEGAASAVNQVAGIGLSYTFSRLTNPLRLYGQLIGEDEAGGLPSCTFHLAGVETQMPLFGAPSTISLEGVDTVTKESTNGFCGQTAAYNNGTYRYTNSEKVMGAAIDTASSSITLRGEHQFSDWSLNWSLGHNNINEPDFLGHRLSSANAEGLLASIGTGFKFANGRLETMAVFQEFDLDRADLSSGVYFGINYSSSF